MLQRLQRLQAQGSLDTAAANFRRMLAAVPGHFHAQLGLGCCAWLAGDDGEAEAIFSAMAAESPPGEDAQIDCAEVLRATGHRDAARRLLRRHQQGSVRLSLLLAELDEQAGDFAAACAGFRAVLTLDGRSETATHKYARLLQRLGDRDGAFAAIDAWADRGDPAQAATACHMRAQISKLEGDTNAVVAALRESIALRPAAFGWRIELAAELRRAGQFEAAETVLTAVAPNHDILLALGEIALARRCHDEALDHAHSAQRAAPQRWDALVLRQRVALDRRDVAAAFAAADEIAALGPDGHIIALRRRLEIFRATAQQAEVRTCLETLRRLQPRELQWVAELARQHRRMGNRADAETLLQQALAKTPDQPMLVTEACDFAAQLEDYETALAFARLLAKIQPDKVSHHLRICRLLQSLGQDKEADAIWTLVQRRFAQYPEVKEERLRRLRSAGDLDSAYREARAIASASPGTMRYWHDLFDLALKRGTIAEVQALLSQAPVQSSGDDVTLLRARSRLARRCKQHAEAETLLHTALALSSADPSLHAELFSLAIRRGSVVDARRHHARLMELQAPERLFTQKPSGQFQSFQGQMLNDLLLDRMAMEDLENTRSLPPDGRIETLLPILQRRPDHIPTAAMITVALSEGGYFTSGSGGMANSAIPKRITQYWDAPTVPADVLTLSGTWATCNPDWEYRRFNNDSALLYLKAHFPPPVSVAFQRAENATTKADILRLAVLVRDGGVWADMDDRCLQPLASFLGSGIEALFWQESSGHIGNNVIAARPNHPVLGKALVLAINALNRGDRDKVWMLTGPGLLTRAFALVLADQGSAWRDWLRSVQVVDEFVLWQQVAYHCQLSYKRQGKHWSKLAFRGAFANPASFSKTLAKIEP